LLASESLDSVFVVILYYLLFPENSFHLFVYPLLHNGFKHYKRAMSSFFLQFLLASIYKSIWGVSPNFVLTYVLISPTVFSPYLWQAWANQSLREFSSRFWGDSVCFTVLIKLFCTQNRKELTKVHYPHLDQN